jgi:hypothetical protein
LLWLFGVQTPLPPKNKKFTYLTSLDPDIFTCKVWVEFGPFHSNFHLQSIIFQHHCLRMQMPKKRLTKSHMHIQCNMPSKREQKYPIVNTHIPKSTTM